MSSPSNALQQGRATGHPTGRAESSYLSTHTQGQSLADVLERVLDKGIVIVGDIQVRLLDIGHQVACLVGYWILTDKWRRSRPC